MRFDSPPRPVSKSHPFLTAGDVPQAISPADFAAHLEAHRSLEQRLDRAAPSEPVISETSKDSLPISVSGHGWKVSGSGRYLVASLAIVAVIEFIWLWLR